MVTAGRNAGPYLGRQQESLMTSIDRNMIAPPFVESFLILLAEKCTGQVRGVELKSCA